jgi:nicotinamidase-related amidase
MSDDNCVVLLIDMQPRFLRRLSATKEDSLLRSQRNVLEYCEKSDVPLAVLEYKRADETHPRLVEPIARVPRRIKIVKSHDDGFNKTELGRTLDEWDPEYLILMGLNASACVLETARTAADRGFQLATAADLIGDGYVHWGNGVRRWYLENGEYFARHSDLIEWMDVRRNCNPVKEKVY